MTTDIDRTAAAELLARFFYEEDHVKSLIDAVLADTETNRPNVRSHSSPEYWRLVCRNICEGHYASCGNSLARLMAAAAHQRPGVSEFTPWRATASEIANRGCRGVRVLAWTELPGTRLLDHARRHVVALGLRFAPELGIRYLGCVGIECVGDGSLGDGHRLVEAMMAEADLRGVAFDVLDLQYLDYYQLIVLEVQRRLYSATLPASTRVEDVVATGWQMAGYRPHHQPAVPIGALTPGK